MAFALGRVGRGKVSINSFSLGSQEPTVKSTQAAGKSLVRLQYRIYTVNMYTYFVII